MVLALIGVAILVTRRLLTSTVGHAFLAIRENEELALAAGIPVFRFKLRAFVIGMIFAGVAGSVYARYVHFVDPTALSFYYTVTVVSMAGCQSPIADAQAMRSPTSPDFSIPPVRTKRPTKSTKSCQLISR